MHHNEYMRFNNSSSWQKYNAGCVSAATLDYAMSLNNLLRGVYNLKWIVLERLPQHNTASDHISLSGI